MGRVLLKKSLAMLGLAAAVGLGAVVSAAPAQLKFVNTNAWNQRPGDTRGGGPFEAKPINQGVVQGLGTNGASAGNYLTFCVELNESVGNTTYNAVQNTEAINGGIGGGNPDPLDARTAFLYTAFLKGTLASKVAGFGDPLDTFTVGAGASGIALQEAIWVIEDEIGANTTTSTLADKLIAMADAAVTGSGEWVGKGIGNVRILNLTDITSGDAKQDQLILIPLPMPALLGLVGLAGVVYMSRRRRSHHLT